MAIIKEKKIVNFKSFQPISQKINSARNLLNRRLKLTSEKFKRKIKNEFYDILKEFLSKKTIKAILFRLWKNATKF